MSDDVGGCRMMSDDVGGCRMFLSPKESLLSSSWNSSREITRSQVNDGQ